MSEHGLKIWDAQGGVLFSGADETMRIVTTVQVRLGAISGTQTIGVPKARVGMYAMVQVFHPYTEWGTYNGYKTGSRSSVPSCRVLDGAIQLYGSLGANYWADVDIILVAT